jgi:aerobic-type carbon monoxide dehydrogenase small subunit (CoxS/CutS family)
MDAKNPLSRTDSLDVSAAKLKGTPGAPVPVDPARWQPLQTSICRFRLNGDPVETAVPAHWTLLEALRYKLGFTGSKQGCDKGDCGACTVRMGGQPVLSCITLALEAEGCDIQTVESMRTPQGLHLLAQAFERHGAAQCGFCTPGVMMSAQAFLEERKESGAGKISQPEIAAALGGNLCRCTGYTKIFVAVKDAWERMQGDAGA